MKKKAKYRVITDAEYLAGNKLIAEFMECRVDKDDPVMKIRMDDSGEGILFQCEWHPDYRKDDNVLAWLFEPQKNWCQLMPVIQKIQLERKKYGFIQEYHRDNWGTCSQVVVYHKEHLMIYWDDNDELKKEIDKEKEEYKRVGEKYDESKNIRLIADSKFDAIWLCLVAFIKSYNILKEKQNASK